VSLVADIYEIKDGVFAITEYLQENAISVSSFLITGKSPAIIETGTPYLADGFMRMIGDLVPPEKISHILITHEHLDHLGGLPEYISEAYNANIIVHNFLRVQLGFMGVVRGIIPVGGGETISLGDHTLEVVYAPVETTGTVSYLLMPEGILFSGDYFGQLGERKLTEGSVPATERLVHDITVLHEGLGLSGDGIKKYFTPLRKKIQILAPSHGTIIRDNANEVFDKVLSTRLDYREGLAAIRRLIGK
jgi:flavorubredoxin